MRHLLDGHRWRWRQRRSRCQLVAIGMMLQVAVAVAFHCHCHCSTLASAFAPPPPSTRARHPSRSDPVLLNAKKRRKKSSSAGDGDGDDDYDREVSYRESAQKYSKKNYDDAAPDEDDNDNNGGDDGGDGVPKQTTLSGGTPLIFEMARRMLVWDDELYESGMLNDAGSRDREGAAEASSPSSTYLSSLSSETVSTLPPPSDLPPMSTSLPRWRPSAIRQQSISNVNPSFRTASPIMTNAGYAGILRRNSRKKNKPSMWRHCLRTYAKMAELENVDLSGTTGDVEDANPGSVREGQIPGVGNNLAPPSANTSGAKRRKKRIRRNTAHHEAALVAASKLGRWEEALLIYRGVESSISNSTAGDTSPTNGTSRRGRNRITDNMVLSVVRACVKGSKVKRTVTSVPVVEEANTDDTTDATATMNETDADLGNSTESNVDASNATVAPTPPPTSFQPMLRELTVEERRKPLDSARYIILAMEEKHDIPLVSRHINPLASAYNRLGLRSEAAALINDHLKDRTPPPPVPTKRNYSRKSKQWKEKQELTSDNNGFEPVKLVDWREDDLDGSGDDENGEYRNGYEELQLNVHQMKSKDRASYSLLVQGAAMDGDWTGAVKELQRMTEAGLHPNSRNLNSWSEVMERGCRPSGNGEENENDNSSYYYGVRRRRSWKKKRDGIWLSNLR